MKKNIFILLIISISFASYAQTNYYVDASNVDDANDGMSVSTAWKTIEKVNQQTFSAGDIILFKRGEIWKGEQLEISGASGTETNLITFAAYPETDDAYPVITSVTEHAHTWENQGGNLWKALNPPSYHPDRLWVDGLEILRANNSSELDGVNFLWLYDAEENGNLYLYSDTDPASKTISYTNGTAALNIDNSNYLIFTHIDFQGGWTSIFINSGTSYIHFTEDNIGKNAANGITVDSEDSTTPNYIHIKDSDFDANFTLDYSMASPYLGTDDRGCSDAVFVKNALNCEIDNNTFKNWGHAAVNIDGNPFGSGDVKVSYISVHDNYTSAPDICYGGRFAVDDAHHCEIFNNRIINTGVQSQFNGYNNHIHHNIIDGTTNPPIIDNAEEISAGIDIDSYSNTDVQNNIYENNLIKNIEGAGIQISTTGDYDITDNIIRNNIIYNCGSLSEASGTGIWVHDNTADCQTSNNLFYNNLVYNSDTEITINFRGTSTDIAGFNALTGTSEYQIADNIAGDPLFTDAANADYHLQANSPCIDAGTNTLATSDFEGNDIPFGSSAPDIGIYEYQGTNQTADYLQSDDIILYPNPAVDFLILSDYDSVGVDDIMFYNTSGQLIKLNILDAHIIDISALSEGIYFVKIISSKGVTVKKIFKK